MNMTRQNHPDFLPPDWVQWLAQDSSGAWWGYSVEPLRNDNGWYENEVGDYICLGYSPAEDWQNSLTKIDPKLLSR